VHRTKISPEFECQGHRSKVKATGDKKNEKVRQICSAVVLCGAVVCSDRRGRGYAGGKISACCLVIVTIIKVLRTVRYARGETALIEAAYRR